MFDKMSFNGYERGREVKVNLVEIDLICCPRRSDFLVSLTNSLDGGQIHTEKCRVGTF